MKKTLFFLITLIIFFIPLDTSFAANEQSLCIRDQISFPGVDQRFLPLPGNSCPAAMTQYGPRYCGRGPHCVQPTHIVMHTTHGALTAQQNYDYFAGGSGYNDFCPNGYCGTGSHFVIGVSGEMLQMVAMGQSAVEYAQAVGGFQPHISIEMGSPVVNGNYSSKTDMFNRGSKKEYDSALQLVKTLMQTYNIPLERVVGHYNLAPNWAGDPGAGWMNDFKRDLNSASGLPGDTQPDNTTGETTTGGTKASACAVTKVGTPSAQAPVCSGIGSVAVGGLPSSGGSPTMPGGGGQPGQPLPSQNTEQIKQVLCSQYKVCPTETNAWNSSNGWTLQQLTALWNIVQKIYESPTYKNYAIGNNVLELTRAGHYTSDPDLQWVWGFHANNGYSNFHEVPGSRLIIITDTTNNAGSQKILEWFFAHEIAHAASFGTASGGWTPGVIGQNPAYQAIMTCGETVSKYGKGSRDENYADAVAYYMTTGEEVTSYWGSAGNFKIDHPCSYNALRTQYFNGKEF